MSFIIDVDRIKQTDNAYASVLGIGTQCVALVQQGPAAAGSSNPPKTTLWRPGLRVHGATATAITKGTVIATFVDGIYPTVSPRHAAVYLSHDEKGIRVIDQWVGKPAPSNSRPLTFRGDDNRDVDNGDLYHVVELTAAPIEGSTGVGQQTLAK